nr:isopentenyl phosphate kinase [Candidatus Sigynarchaeota archaeon]
MRDAGVTIIKLGGSCFSDKKILRSLHIDVLDSISKQLQGMNVPIVVVHGGGSYGHPVAKKYEIQKGRQPGVPNQSMGFCLTHEAMVDLNREIVGNMLKHEIPAYSVQTSAIFTCREGKVKDSNFTTINELLDQRFVPVLYGDSVVDDAWGFSILSGDSIVVELANGLHHVVKRIVYLMDVDGLFNVNPKLDSRATLFHEVSLCGGHLLVKSGKELVKIENTMEQTDGVIDVTGGILNKLTELQQVRRKGIEIDLINGRAQDRLSALLAGQSVPHTRIHIIEEKGESDG